MRRAFCQAARNRQVPEEYSPILIAVWMMTQTRIVAVSYLNTIPYIYGISRAGGTLRDGLLLCPPRLCAEALRNGEANVGLIPVAAIPENPDLNIVTPFCIGAHGPVRTVVLASNYPVEELETIGLDCHSRTSIRLARILAAERWHISPQWMPLTDYSFTEGGKTGYILIGDKVFTHESKFRYLYDLAAEWQAMTHLPFAFAAWVARSEVPAEDIERLEQALRYGTSHIQEAVAWSEYASRPYAVDYLTKNIDFVLDAPKRRGMELYWQLGRRYDPPSPTRPDPFPIQGCQPDAGSQLLRNGR